MAKDPSQPSNLVKIGEAARILGLHTDTLRRWEKSAKITSIRTPGGTRLYSLNELKNLIPKMLDNSPPPPKPEQSSAKNPRRSDEEGVYYHIYNRGVEKRIIFETGEDYRVFLGFLEEYLTPPKNESSIEKDFEVRGRTFKGTPHQPKNYLNKVELIAYNLMPDHFHLLVHQVTKGSVESFIRSLCTRYSMYFNKKYRHTGALFEGPYKSVRVMDEPRLLHLTRYLHHAGGYCSYPEYSGARITSWVKPKKGTGNYKDSVEMGLIEDITFESETAHLERRGLARNEEIRSRIPEFLATAAVFLLLLALGIRNIMSSTTISPIPPSPPAVLSETEDIEEIKPKIILTIKINEASASVNIRQKPTIQSEKIGQAKDGDSFEFLSLDSGWYGVKLATDSAGFISAEYVTEETNN